MQFQSWLFLFYSPFCFLWDLSSCKMHARINTNETNDPSHQCVFECSDTFVLLSSFLLAHTEHLSADT